MTVAPGVVYLVGAGPGDPGLITARGLRLLRRADVVVHDRLVAPELLDEIAAGAIVIDVGKRPRRPSPSQTTINALLVMHARGGRVVVRLKGGDPFIFGRGAEEVDACHAAEIECEVVPGVTSAIAGPAAAGVAVTERGIARSVSIVTPAVAGGLDLESVRRVAGAETLSVLMGRAALPAVVSTLIEAGRAPETPVVAIERATMPGEASVRGTLDTIVDVVARARLDAPLVITIGDVARCRPCRRALSGRRILLTRPREAGRALARRLRHLGAEVIECPLIRIRPLTAVPPRRALAAYAAIVFTSRHGVRGFGQWLARADLDARALAGVAIAVVGPRTAEALADLGLRADIVPDTYRATALADAIAREITPASGPVLFPCGTRALRSLPERLEQHDIEIERMHVYETLAREPDPAVLRQLHRGVDAIVFHAPSAVASFVRASIPVGDARIVSIGPTTARAANALGIGCEVAAQYCDDGVIDRLRSDQWLEVEP